METITFYSYKGGVGRTLALANVAMYLSRFGQDVCIMDFDLEAPGLHYKFPKLIDSTDIDIGLVDYIFEFTHNNVIPKSLARFSLMVVPHSESRGGIHLIPAGNVLSSTYWRKLASINWYDFFYEKNSEGVPFFLELKERIRRELKPDFLLIDSRTGITEMSGICTYLFADKVVFLIINNKENIEGARQILQSAQRLERLPRQKPIEVVFALTRIPFPEEEKEKKVVGRIVEQTKALLNEPVEDLESQLNIQNICVLHSDRKLELSESLRISQQGITEEAPLSRDYLRLFSRIIPEKIVTNRLAGILEGIGADIWDDPDRMQEELEELVASYPHKESLEKLLDFYFIRNESEEKILGKFHELWEISGDINPRALSRYISMFMKEGRGFSYYSSVKFDLEIVERYIDSNPANRIEVELKLSEAYRDYHEPKMAIKHYSRLLKEVEEKEPILDEMLKVYIGEKSYEEPMKLLEHYSSIIEGNMSLCLKKIELLFRAGRIEQMRKQLDEAMERNLADARPSLYFEVMESLGKSDEMNKKLNTMLNEALGKESGARKLYEIGRLYQRLGRRLEFENRIRGQHRDADEIIYRLRRR